jgi:hypothetical protein
MSGPSMPSMTTGPSRLVGGEHETSAPRSSASTLATRHVIPAGASTFSGARFRPHPTPDPADAIRRYLAARRTKSAKALAAKAVVLIDPQNRADEIVWPAGSQPGR